MNEPRYTDEEFALILARAAEIQGGSGSTPSRPEGISLEEMKAVALEVGIDPAAIERAAAMISRTGPTSLVERIAGGPLTYSLDRTVEVELTPERLGRVGPEIRTAAHHFGSLDTEPGGISWRTVGEPTQIFVSVISDPDGARVRVTSDRSGGLVLTAFLNIGGGLLAAGITGAIIEPHSALVSLGLVASGASVGFVSARAAWKATSRTVQAKLGAISDAVASVLAREG